MRFVDRRRATTDFADPLEDPISGVAHLFDVSIVFIVTMMIALFAAYNLLDLFDPSSNVTIVKQTEDGEMEILEKRGEEVTISRVTDRELSGAGVRLGTAYELPDGRVVYVPEE